MLHYKQTQLHRRFGGVVLISSSLIEEIELQGSLSFTGNFGQTPVLITHGEKDNMIPIEKATKTFEFLCNRRSEETQPKDEEKDLSLQGKVLMNFKSYPNKGHAMVNSAEEAKDLIEFFSFHLALRQIAFESMMEARSLQQGFMKVQKLVEGKRGNI